MQRFVYVRLTLQSGCIQRYVEHKLLNAMEKLTKSLPLFKERGCTVSLALDIRTNRRKSSEYPLSVRFTLERRAFLLSRWWVLYSKRVFGHL